MRRRRNQPPPTPRAIDPASGFKVPLSNLVRQWDGEMVDRRFVDKRNPQDFVRGRADKMALPFARPEAPDRYMAQNILWEDGRPMTLENGAALLGEGEVVTL
jgi:hypothetical protein